MKGKRDHVAWYQHEVALYVHHHLDLPFSSFNIDKDMDPYFKEGWCKRNHPATLGNIIVIDSSFFFFFFSLYILSFFMFMFIYSY